MSATLTVTDATELKAIRQAKLLAEVDQMIRHANAHSDTSLWIRESRLGDEQTIQWLVSVLEEKNYTCIRTYEKTPKAAKGVLIKWD